MRCSFNCPTNAIKIGFLESWKVNGEYKLSEIDKNDELKGDYLLTHKTNFFKLFPKQINKINKLYDKYFNKN